MEWIIGGLVGVVVGWGIGRAVTKAKARYYWNRHVRRHHPDLAISLHEAELAWLSGGPEPSEADFVEARRLIDALASRGYDV